MHSGLVEDLGFIVLGLILYLWISRPRYEESTTETSEHDDGYEETWKWPRLEQTPLDRSGLDEVPSCARVSTGQETKNP